MRRIFLKTISDAPSLRLELFSSNGDRIVERITVDISEGAIWVRDGEFAILEVFLNANIAETCRRFFDTNHQNKYMVCFKLLFGGEFTYYHGYDLHYITCLPQIRSGSGILMRSQMRLSSLHLLIDAVPSEDLENIPQTAFESGTGETEFSTILDRCLAWQQANPPKKLSPLEQMRRKASGMYVTTPSAPKTETVAVATEQQQIFNPASLKTTPGSKDYMQDLEKIIGLKEVKEEFERMVIAYRFQQERAARLGTVATRNSMHMCFLGGPGTGKTTIARVVAGYLYHNGIIPKNQCVEISGLDLIANFLGQTSEKTRIILEHAKGGVLFIDEAYAIAGDQYGQEAISVLLKALEDDRDQLVVIFAGYERDMSSFLDMNEGFKSRINRYFHFHNYNTSELADIFMRILQAKSLVITEEALKASLQLFARACNAPDFANGRFVRNFVEKIENRHIFNIRNRTDNTNINVITAEDVLEESI